MLQKTRGIVFKTTDYGDTSIIVQVFTEKFGLQSYIVNGAKKPKAKMSRNLFQPLHLLDMVVYHKNTSGVQRIKEVKNAPVLQSIPYNVIKSSVAIFLNEVLYKAVKQQSAEEHLFSFVFNSIEWLDHQQEGLANFHLLFLIQLTRYLGFYPDTTFAGSADYFGLKDGIFSRYKPDSVAYLSQPYSQLFYGLINCTFTDCPQIRISNDERRYLLDRLLDYYAMHIESFGNIRSLGVLEEVMG